MKKVFSLTLALLLLLNISASFAQENNNAENDISENVELFLRNNDVPPQQIQALLTKKNNGVLWDCQQEDKLKTVPESFYIFDPSEGSETRYFRFEDGSFYQDSNRTD